MPGPRNTSARSGNDVVRIRPVNLIFTGICGRARARGRVPAVSAGPQGPVVADRVLCRNPMI